MITHLEPDILESKVKWALGSISTNKAIRGDGIPVELFQFLRDDPLKVLHSICQQTQQWPQDWKRSVFIPIPKAMQKNFKTTIQLCSFHMLARLCSKSLKRGFSIHEPRTSRCTSWVSKRPRNQRSSCQCSLDHEEIKEVSEKFLLH